MVEREKALLVAAPAVRIYERALKAIAVPHCTRNVDGHVTGSGFELASPLPRRGSHAPFGLLMQQRIQSTLENLREVAARDGMPEQVAGLLDLVSQRRACGELDAIARGRKWFELSIRGRAGLRRCG